MKAEEASPSFSPVAPLSTSSPGRSTANTRKAIITRTWSSMKMTVAPITLAATISTWSAAGSSLVESEDLMVDLSAVAAEA
jgi:hypothetical protein